MQIALIRSLGIWYGRENLIRSYFFYIIYAVLYLKSLRKFFEKRYGPFYSDIFFRNYLLKICMRRLTLNFSQEVRYSSIFDYMGKNKKLWSKEKFFVGCLGLEIEIKNENDIFEIINNSRYNQIMKEYNLSKKNIKFYLYKIIRNK